MEGFFNDFNLPQTVARLTKIDYSSSKALGPQRHAPLEQFESQKSGMAISCEFRAKFMQREKIV